MRDQMSERMVWQGWSSRAADTVGEWVDLTRLLRNDMPRIAFFPSPRFERIMAMPQDRLNVTELQMVAHIGTHLDAPSHFIPGGPDIDEIPLDRFYGPGVVWSLPGMEPFAEIGPEAFESASPAVGRDEIVLLDTGWARHFGTATYDQHPSLTVEAARWLVEHQVKAIGFDFPTPDLGYERRGEGFDWPVHQVLLSNGVLIGEHLTNVDQLAGERVEVFCLPLHIDGSDGGPARVIARRRTE
jgi:arylformamidase